MCMGIDNESCDRGKKDKCWGLGVESSHQSFNLLNLGT